MDSTDFQRYSPGVEVEQPNEGADVAATLEAFGRLREKIFQQTGHAVRDAHAKSHGILGGTLQVSESLPPELAQGIFAAPRRYPVIVRYSTAPGEIGHDGAAALRGFAIKVIGVEGTRLPSTPEATTQDFLLTNHRTIPTGDVASYRRQAALIERITGLPPTVQRASTTLLRAGRSVLDKVSSVDAAGGAGGLAKPLTNILGESFYSMAALRYGNHVAKLGAFPVSDSLRALTGAGIDSGNPNALREQVIAYYADHDAEYEIRVQLCTDLTRMPVEDASVVWPEDISPYRTVARLHLPAQDAGSPPRRIYGDDILSFTPFTGVEEHRPLGSINRVRRAAYEQSSGYRHTTNARPRIEPSSVAELPA